MARGFLSGALVGAVFSTATAGLVSIYVGAPSAPDVGDTAPGAVNAPDVPQDGQTAPANDSDLVQDSAPLVDQPAQDDVSAAAQAGSDVPIQPQTGQASDLTAPTSTEETTGAIAVDSEAPVLPSPQAVLPDAPSDDTELSISTDPAQPPTPDVPEAETAFEEPEQAEDAAPVNTQTATRPAIGEPAVSLIQSDAPTDQADAVRPIDAYATAFENQGDKPLMAIVLIDSGEDLSGEAVGVAALRSFPAPITFAVNASLPDAAARMTRYREDGFEVLAMIDLPNGATATDAEVTLNAVFSAMPEVVGVIEGVSAGLQESREASDQLTKILAQSGHGLVTQSKGLNTVQKLAAREGVPSAVVFRDFDSADQTPTVIRRFLDQAAFRAGQEGGVIMLGRVRPDTISALLLWGLADRAERVSLAPVSAVLKQRAQQ